MDLLSKFLGGIRASGSSVSEAVLKAPWVIRFDNRAPLTMLTMVTGEGILLTSGGEEVKLRSGQSSIVKGSESFVMADSAASIDRSHIEYRHSCIGPDDEDDELCLGQGRWGNSADGATAMFVGVYRSVGRGHERLLRALPPALVIDDEPEVCRWLEDASVDIADRRPGAQALIDRLFDWGLVCTLRTWFDEQGLSAPNWYRGIIDPVVGPALEAIHEKANKQWTVAALADEAKVSRALFAKRFANVMGEPPMTYLTAWRIEIAEEMLTDPDASLAQVARTVGYADAFGFSTAFKRQRGVSPSQFRRAANDPTQKLSA